ncbi:TlpA family protein disulfide reductase [Pseudoflavitalea sp. G-6-1-2]|uniref:TlpA family protein disulfide reductase n=1 Tax=Pseudoflavitalea sp. G-6-1-2 TaxID=2728841 RepID=UPI00146F7DEB|nr:TlpA disulfide reductase family protein [Pseudoflavitalea sp. G-6-1-2]NML21753.1 TlpA family protein disulfide reductase [Pseudoflavitalea sp. G-6-1-2]
MKKQISLLLLLAAASLHSIAQKTSHALVQGNYNKRSANNVVLYKVVAGTRQEFASMKLNDKKEFAFQVPSVEAGYYYLAQDPNRGGIRIWLSPGTQLRMQVSDTGYTLQSASPENNLLHQWETMRMPVRAMGNSLSNDNPRLRSLSDTGTYHSFFPKLHELLANAASFRKRINTSNKAFNDLLRFTIDADVQQSALHFLLTPKSAHPTPEELPAYYRDDARGKLLATTAIYRLGEGQSILQDYSILPILLGKKPEEKADMLDWSLQLIPNDTLRGDIVIGNLQRANSFETVLDNTEKYGRYILTPEQKLQKEAIFDKLVKYQKGAPAYNFNLDDINDKKVSLKSLAGKVVVLDVWATWCGPCKAEIPHLKKLEAAMHGKDVVFVSIGTDKPADKEKWKKFVQDEQLGGVQLYDPSGAAIHSYYKIPGIPRFMVFDKAGKIVSADAPRPSTPELQKMIEQYL